MAFDAIETPFGKSDKIIGGAATYIAWSASNFYQPIKQISVVGGDFPQEELDQLHERGVELEGVQIKKNEKKLLLGRPLPYGHEHPRHPGYPAERTRQL